VFRYGRPFCRVKYRTAFVIALKELVIVRNAVAHPSQVAWRKFAALAEEKSYPTKRPADFLLASREGATELEHQVGLVRALGRGLAEPSEADVEAILGPERTFNSGERDVPPGAYKCTRCTRVVSLPAGGGLPVCVCDALPTASCPSCGQTSPCTSCSKPRSPVSAYERLLLP
jgi:hypothetical protein